MENNERREKNCPPIALFWAERVLTLLSGAAISVVASKLVYGVSEPVPIKLFFGAMQPRTMLIVFAPYLMVAVVMVAFPGLEEIHKAAMFLGFGGLALACPIVGWVLLLNAARALRDPGFLVAGVAAMLQSALIIIAARLSGPADHSLSGLYLGGESRPELRRVGDSQSSLWLVALIVLALGLIILIPMLALMILGAGM